MPPIVLPKLEDVSQDFPVEIEHSLVHLRHCEPVGYYYESTFTPLVSSTTGSPSGSPTTAKSPGKLDGEKREKKATTKKGGVKMTEEDLLVDWYDVLKITDEEGATEDDIRTAYRQRCLETHPDKQKDRSDELFKKVQRAFDLLGNAESRRAFDSSRPFDDTIPGETVSEADFYTTFHSVFERNKKWGVDPVIPSLGTEDTPIEEVNKFYSYWMTFKSWRDFSHDCELEEINEDMSREEKRWYQRENQRLLDKARRLEGKRVRNLVERAQSNDPRLRKKREEELAKREKEIADRQAERDRLREEERRRKQEIVDAKKREEEEKLKAMQDAKTVIKDSHNKLTTFLKEHDLLDTTRTNLLLPNAIRMPNITWIFNKCNKPELAAAMVEAVVSQDTEEHDGEIAAVLAFNAEVERVEHSIGVNRYGEPVKIKVIERVAPVVKKTKAVDAGTWTEDDELLLQKGIAQFPGGTVDRWTKLATHMREKFTEDQILTKTKEMEKIHQNDRSHMKQKMPDLPSATHADPALHRDDVDNWSADQQKQLEAALREFKDYKAKDKYQKISNLVTGKNAKHCFERYKHLCTLRNKK